LTKHNDPEEIREARILQQKLFMDGDGFRIVLDSLFDARRRIKKLFPKNLVKLGLEEAVRIAKAKEAELLALDMDSEEEEEVIEEGEEEEEEEEEVPEENEDDIGEDELEEEDQVTGNQDLSIPYQKSTWTLQELGTMPSPLRKLPTVRSFTAGIRVLISLLWHGEKEIAATVREKLREPAVFQNLLFTAMQAEHYPNNIGVKVCLLITELLRLPPDAEEEEADTIGLYESTMVFMTDGLCGAIQGSLKNTVVMRRLQLGVTLHPREESFIEAITACWALLARQIGWVEFSEDDDIDEIVDKFVGTELFDIKALNVLLQWMYYDQALKKQEWGWDRASLRRRDRINENINVVMASFLRNSEAYKFDILVQINRLDFSYDVQLVMAWVCEMLKIAGDLSYDFAIARYMLANGHTVADSLERTIAFSWIYMPSPLDVRSPLESLPGNPFSKVKKAKKLPQPAPRLIWCSHRAIYICSPSWRVPCTVCEADKFCPEGPSLELVIEYDQVIEIIRGFAGTMMRIVYESSYLGLTIEKDVDIMSTQYGEIDRLIDSIILSVGGESNAHVVQDQVTWTELSEHVNGGTPLTLSLTLSLMLSLTLSLMLSLTLSLMLSLTLRLMLSLTLSLMLSLTLTLTLIEGVLPPDLDEINEVILVYTPVLARVRSMEGSGLGPPLNDWEHQVLVLTCGVQPGTAIQER